MSNVAELLSVVGKLSLSGAASLDQAVRLASGSAADDLTAKPLRRDLEGLGHIRCVYGKVREAQALAPRLCMLPGGTLTNCQSVLTGARTLQLVARLHSLCGKHGVKSESESLPDGLPEQIRLTGRYEALKSLASELHIDVGDDPFMPDAWRLLHILAPMRERLGSLLEQPTGYQTIPRPNASDHVYDPRNGSFALWEYVGRQYSSNFLLIRKTPYDYRLAKKIVGEGWRLYLTPLSFDPRWAMWAVRLASVGGTQGLPHSTDRTLRVPLGCTLPTELHQVACLCSGRPPTKTNSHFEYHDVPPVIQFGIHQRLAIESTQ